MRLRIPKTFWSDFFKGPLQLSLEKQGSSLEELMVYCIVHHDNHFWTEWGEDDFNANLSFDTVRTIVDPPRFHHLYLWASLAVRHKKEVQAVIRMIHFAERDGGTHDNVFELLRDKE